MTVEESLPGREPISRLSTPWGFLARVFATGCFVGHLPLAPGTWGSLLALVLGYLFLPGSWLLQLLVILVIFFLGVWTSGAAEKFYGHDGRAIVIDEVLGMLVAVFVLPKQVGFYLAAFILFRFFDVVKPPPSRRMESLPAGWGVMMDDLLAGIYAFLVMRLIVVLG